MFLKWSKARAESLRTGFGQARQGTVGQKRDSGLSWHVSYDSQLGITREILSVESQDPKGSKALHRSDDSRVVDLSAADAELHHERSPTFIKVRRVGYTREEFFDPTELVACLRNAVPEAVTRLRPGHHVPAFDQVLGENP